jgi:hypothetical protein
MMMHRNQYRRDYMRVEFRRFLTGIILIPTMVIRWARGITVLTATGPTVPAWNRSQAPIARPGGPATSPGVTRHLRDNPISAATAMPHHHLGCSRATMIGSPIWRITLRRAADARRQPASPSAQSAACGGASRGSPCP